MSPRIQAMQVTVYVMCGGGILGKFAAAKPADFYIDALVNRRPFTSHEIKRAVASLVEQSQRDGLDPHNLDVGKALSKLPNMGGVF